MPSFDITSKVDWQEIDNAVNQALKEMGTRFDFRGIETEISQDSKGNTLTLNCGEEGKLDAMRDILQTKLVKRGISLFAFEYDNPTSASGRSAKQIINVKVGIDKDMNKQINKLIKDNKIKVSAKLQDEAIRVTGKKRDDLQSVIALLKGEEEKLKIAMQFGNFRD